MFLILRLINIWKWGKIWCLSIRLCWVIHIITLILCRSCSMTSSLPFSSQYQGRSDYCQAYILTPYEFLVWVGTATERCTSGQRSRGWDSFPVPGNSSDHSMCSSIIIFHISWFLIYNYLIKTSVLVLLIAAVMWYI